MFALLLAVVIVYMVLASQFNSLIHPFTIMLALPLAIVGALGGLLIAGKTLNFLSMIGIILLMGLVTKNSILLIDFTNVLGSAVCPATRRSARPARSGCGRSS